MKPDEFIANQPDTDQILHYLTSAARSIVKGVDTIYSAEGKQTITHIYNWLRSDLMAGNFKEFEKGYDEALRKYPDEASELYDTMYEHAGLGMEGTYEQFMAKCTDQGMAEGVVSTPGRFKPGLPIPTPSHTKDGAEKNQHRAEAASNFARAAGGQDKAVAGYDKSAARYKKIANNNGVEEGVGKERLRHKPISDDDKYAGMGMPSFGHNPKEDMKDREFFKQAFAKPKQVKEDASCGATSAGAFATGAVGAVKPKKIIKRKSAVGEGIDQVDESYWDQVLQKVAKDQAERKANPNKTYEKNPLSHDKNGVYCGDKDLAGNPVKKVKELAAPSAAHPFNKRTDAELKGFVKDAPEAAAAIKKRGGNSARIEKDAVTANVIKQSRQNDPRK